jgi:hypothetical protein
VEGEHRKTTFLEFSYEKTGQQLISPDPNPHLHLGEFLSLHFTAGLEKLVSMFLIPPLPLHHLLIIDS